MDGVGSIPCWWCGDGGYEACLERVLLMSSFCVEETRQVEHVVGALRRKV